MSHDSVRAFANQAVPGSHAGDEAPLLAEILQCDMRKPHGTDGQHCGHYRCHDRKWKCDSEWSKERPAPCPGHGNGRALQDYADLRRRILTLPFGTRSASSNEQPKIDGPTQDHNKCGDGL